MSEISSLPANWVDRIFEKLTLTYGAAWLKKWEGVDIAQVKADWGHELRGYQQSPHAIKHALEHLPPDFPPTVLQFRDICNRRVELPVARLPAPAPDPRVVEAVVKGMKRARSTASRFDWAYALQEREKTGGSLTMAQRTMWRAALEKVPMVEIIGSFNAIEPARLPPAMREEMEA